MLKAFGLEPGAAPHLSRWTDIVELMSIFKRLRAFEATLSGKPLDKIEEPVL